jgi:glycosyltransferase involved in cell wall biosynthesis
MLVATSVATDTRVLREAQALVDGGHRVHIIGKDVPADLVAPDGVSVSSAGASSVFASRAGGARPRDPLRRAARWALLPQHRNQAFGSWARDALALAREREFDVVHAHDFTALEIGAQLADERGVPFVYDSHELWSGRSREYRPTPLQDRRERRTERELGARAAAVITVGDGLADELRRRFGWQRVVVVRNSFPHPGPDAPPAASPPTGLVYAGRIGGHRDLETVLAAVPDLPLPVSLLGPADAGWLAEHTDALAGVAVGDAVAVDDVTAVLRAAGISLVPMAGGYDNHRLAQPNKLFHAVHAGVPVVAADLPALRAVIERYDLGRCYRPGDPRDLVRAVGEVAAEHARFVAAAVAAREDLSWEADARTLRELYGTISGQGAARG